MRKLFATLVLAWLITPAHAQQQNPLAFVSAIFDDNVHVVNTTTDTVVTAWAKRILRVIAEKDRATPKGGWFWKLPPKEED